VFQQRFEPGTSRIQVRSVVVSANLEVTEMRERQWGVHVEGTEDKECLLKKYNTNFGEEEMFAVL